MRCRNISLAALSRSAWLLRWQWLLRHQHKHQHGQRQRLRVAAASEAGAVAAAEAATAATAINKTHTFCEGDAYTHTLTHISDFSPSSPAGCTVVKSTLIYATAMCYFRCLYCCLLPFSENWILKSQMMLNISHAQWSLNEAEIFI